MYRASRPTDANEAFEFKHKVSTKNSTSVASWRKGNKSDVPILEGHFRSVQAVQTFDLRSEFFALFLAEASSMRWACFGYALPQPLGALNRRWFWCAGVAYVTTAIWKTCSVFTINVLWPHSKAAPLSSSPSLS